MTVLTTLLEVFPGWPAAAQGSPMEWLALLLIGPAALGALITVLFSANHWLGRDRGDKRELEA